MSDFYTHPKYDAWKLATPWDGDDEEELPCCSKCGDPHDQDDLNDDDLCRRCEDDLLIAEEF